MSPTSPQQPKTSKTYQTLQPPFGLIAPANSVIQFDPDPNSTRKFRLTTKANLDEDFFDEDDEDDEGIRYTRHVHMNAGFEEFMCVYVVYIYIHIYMGVYVCNMDAENDGL